VWHQPAASWVKKARGNKLQLGDRQLQISDRGGHVALKILILLINFPKMRDFQLQILLFGQAKIWRWVSWDSPPCLPLPLPRRYWRQLNGQVRLKVCGPSLAGLRN